MYEPKGSPTELGGGGGWVVPAMYWHRAHIHKLYKTTLGDGKQDAPCGPGCGSMSANRKRL